MRATNRCTRFASTDERLAAARRRFVDRGRMLGASSRDLRGATFDGQQPRTKSNKLGNVTNVAARAPDTRRDGFVADEAATHVARTEGTPAKSANSPRVGQPVEGVSGAMRPNAYTHNAVAIARARVIRKAARSESLDTTAILPTKRRSGKRGSNAVDKPARPCTSSTLNGAARRHRARPPPSASRQG